MNTVDLAARDIPKLLAVEEGHFVDVKAREIAPGKLSKAVAAFANADGGELYVGIAENKKTGKFLWEGFRSPEDANGHLQAFEELFPLGRDFQYEFLRHPTPAKGLVLHVAVQKTREIKVASDGKVYVRRGAQSLRVADGDPLERLRRNKGLTSFEVNTVAVPVDFVSESDVLRNFLEAVIPAASDPERWLKKQLLIREGNPTVAGVLIFADEPQAALPKRCAIKIYRYRTSDAEGSRANLAFDPITIEGCLYDQIPAAVDRAVKLIEEVRILTPNGLEPIAYPIETLHEIITNAVIHRDYGIADDVHVRIYDNRVEVESPGRLPAHITVANILGERFARNGSIVRLINKFPNPPNKDVGEGLNTAFAAMKKLELRDPVIRELENAVLVEIRHQKLGSPEQIIMDYLERYPTITNRQVRELTGIGSENKVKNTFYRLAKANQIERVPGRGGGSAAWQRTSQ